MRKTPKKTKKTKSSAPAGKQRLQKILAASGIDSRRKCETLILEHAVSVNGEIVNELPAFADPEKDDIRVDGQRIKQTKKVYFLLNKPKGVICTSSDPQKRQKQSIWWIARNVLFVWVDSILIRPGRSS